HRHGGTAALRGPRDGRDQDLRASVGVAELDLHPSERDRPDRRAYPLWKARAAERRFSEDLTMASVDLLSKIPNNVDLSSDKKLQRALEQWLPNYLDWWQQVGPDGF